MKRSISVFITGSMALMMPFAALAGNTTAESAISTEDILENMTTDTVPVPMPPMIEGKGGGSGGGGGVMNSLYYPGPTGGGVQVTADVTNSVKPDFVALNAYCESGKMTSKLAVRDALQQIYTDIKNNVGKDGRVRKNGTVSAYPYYDPTGIATESYNGTLNIFIRVLNKNKAQDISDFIEQKNCTVNWDVRLVKTQSYELSILDELATQLNARKAVFEKLLQKRLTRISGATLSTWVDSYGSYDPDADTVDATTTLTVTFDLGGRATLPTPMPMEKAMPRG